MNGRGVVETTGCDQNSDSGNLINVTLFHEHALPGGKIYFLLLKNSFGDAEGGLKKRGKRGSKKHNRDVVISYVICHVFMMEVERAFTLTSQKDGCPCFAISPSMK